MGLAELILGFQMRNLNAGLYFLTCGVMCYLAWEIPERHGTKILYAMTRWFHLH